MNPAPEEPGRARELRAACVHEYAHLVVARHFGASGFVTVVRIAAGDATIGWHGRFQLSGELNDDEWRIVAIAGTIAEWIDAQAACDARSLLESLRRPGALSESDARLAHGYGTDEVERCVSILKMSWHEIETQAAERAASIEALARSSSPQSLPPYALGEGTQCLCDGETLDSRLRGNDDWGH